MYLDVYFTQRASKSCQIRVYLFPKQCHYAGYLRMNIEYMYVHWLYMYIDNTMHLCIWKVNCVHSVIYIYVDMSSWMCVWWFMIRAVVCVYQNATFMWFLFIDAEPVDRKYFNMFFLQVSSGQEAWYQWNVALQNIYLCQYNNSPRVLFWSYGLRYSNKFYAGEYICFLCNKVFFLSLVPCLAYIYA